MPDILHWGHISSGPFALAPTAPIFPTLASPSRGSCNDVEDACQRRGEATHAHRTFCLSLTGEFPGYSENVWGITASDSRKGYVAWGGRPRHHTIDGSVVPAAAARPLMLAPDITLPALREMRRRFGDRIYGRYGFAGAFHPTDGW